MDRAWVARIEELSRIGLRLRAEGFASITHEDVLVLQEIEIDGERTAMELRCSIVYHDGASVVGVAISSDSAAATMQRYFEIAYYPSYIRYLEHIVGFDSKSARAASTASSNDS